jgi:two-component system KDP operon response regulator KdpE
MFKATLERDPCSEVPSPRVLIVEDNPRMLQLLEATLSSHGMCVLRATTGEAGLAEALARRPHIVLLDLGLPDLDGLEVTKRLRHWTETPILIISARSFENDKIAALDAGANDYVTKPFGTGELLARVRVWLKQVAARGESADEKGATELTVGDLKIDLVKHLVFVGGKEVHLTRTEYKLLATLMRNVGSVMTHKQLLETVWGPKHAEETQYLRVYLGQLRHKIEKRSRRDRYISSQSRALAIACAHKPARLRCILYKFYYIESLSRKSSRPSRSRSETSPG